MKIKDVAKITGVKASTIRYYDTLKLLGDVSRTDGATRIFTLETVARIEMIKGLQNMGFKLEDVRLFFQKPDGAVNHEKILSLMIDKEQELEKLAKQIVKQKSILQSVRKEVEKTWLNGECIDNAQLQRFSLAMSGKDSV